MQHEWLEAGFFVVSDATSPKRAGSPLPSRIVTVSTCIVESYPDEWALPWFQTSPEDLERIRASLGLNRSAFSGLRAWVEEAMTNGDYGWPNVFLSLEAAREFGQKFLGAVRNRRLLGLSLAEEVARAFVREEALPEGRGGSGTWSALQRRRRLEHPGPPLGFDVLGAEHGGDFHTFTCNSLERHYSE